MKKILLTISMFFLLMPCSSATLFEGGIVKEAEYQHHQVIDAISNEPIPNALVKIPQLGISTKTDINGKFVLKEKINSKTILSVEKSGYKPFSMTLAKLNSNSKMTLAIEKSTFKNIKIETEMFHLGDNNYSDNSANANSFKVHSIGPFYSKQFKISNCSKTETPYLVIGSIIGIDTKMAKTLGQNKISSAYSSPPEIYFNGVKVAEIQINGDNQKIPLPKNLINYNNLNDIVIKTGKNLLQTSYIDYDDIEFMNLSIEII